MDHEPKEERMDTKAPSMLMPAVIAGGALGFASGLPISSCACCLWAAGAGFLAAFLYSKNCKQAGSEFDTGKGGVLGLLTGVVFGVVGAMVNAVFSLVTGGLDIESMREAIEANPMISDPAAAEQALQVFESVGPMFFILIFALIWIILGVLFAAVGGLIGGSAFKVEALPPNSGGGWSSNPPPMTPGDSVPPPPATPTDPYREQ
jgi:hypothetical protein